MVIYATTAGGISVGSLFLAGYLPGALLAIVLMIGSYIISVKENYPKGSPFTIKGFIKQLGTSIWLCRSRHRRVRRCRRCVHCYGVRCYRSYLLSAGLRLCLQGP